MGGLLALTYTRPKHVHQQSLRNSDDSFARSEKGDSSLKSGTSGSSVGIPESLAFDKIMNGGTCPVKFHLQCISARCEANHCCSR